MCEMSRYRRTHSTLTQFEASPVAVAGRIPQLPACWLLASMVAVAAGSAACERPKTDILNTTSEDIGNYTVAPTSSSDGQFSAHVCVDRAGSTDEIVRRITQQLANHEYSTITLDVYTREQPVGRYVSSRSNEERSTLGSDSNPCVRNGDERQAPGPETR